MTIKVCIAGATGWVGKPLALAVAQSADMALVGAVARSARGKNLKDLTAGAGPDVVVSGSVMDALQAPADVLVDYTAADAVKGHVLAALGKGVRVVIGSSGLTEKDYLEIQQAALDAHLGVLAAGNFSITAVLLERFASEAARYLAHWEIIDYAAGSKPDAPSGTARELASRLAEVRRPVVAYPVEKTIGEIESRGTDLGGSRVHSVRLPSYMISLEAIFAGDDERLTIRHDSGSSPAPYIEGTLLAIRKVMGLTGLVRGLDRIL